MSEVAVKTVDEEIVIPKIKPQNVEINAEHFCWREFLIRLPQDVSWVSIHEQADEVWRLVQSNPHTSLRVLDRLWLMSHDESELASATVCVATGTKVVLANFKKFSYGGRDQTAQWADDVYKIAWDGSGYAIWRKTDGVRVKPGSFSSIELAKAEVRRLYPVQLGTK